jgi:hypothetical protein
VPVECLPLRRFEVDVGSSGVTDVRFGDTHPNLLGWEFSWRTTHGTNFAVIQAVIDCVHPLWYQSAVLHFGDQNAAPTFTQGGVLFVPFPVVKFSFYDGQGVGGATVQIVGRPVMRGDVSRAGSTLITSVGWSLDASAVDTVDVPENASAFVVTSSDLAASSITVESVGLNNETLMAFEVDHDAVHAGQVTGMPWRETPYMDNNSNGAIAITNNDGANSTEGQVYFLFDLAKGR